MAESYGQPCEQGVRISVRLTHQDLANLLGTTRVTVTRFIGVLRDQGWLEVEHSRHVVVKSVKALNRRQFRRPQPMESSNPLQQLLVRGIGTTNVVADRLKSVIQGWVTSGRIDASQASSLIEEVSGACGAITPLLKNRPSNRSSATSINCCMKWAWRVSGKWMNCGAALIALSNSCVKTANFADRISRSLSALDARHPDQLRRLRGLPRCCLRAARSWPPPQPRPVLRQLEVRPKLPRQAAVNPALRPLNSIPNESNPAFVCDGSRVASAIRSPKVQQLIYWVAKWKPPKSA